MNGVWPKILSRVRLAAGEFYYSLAPDRGLLGRLEESPGSLAIEPINICNANCVFCGYQYQERPRGRMEASVLEKALREYVLLGGGMIHWSVVVGDPLLDPECVERIRYIRSFPSITRVETTTNCLNLHQTGARELLQSGLDAIHVSTAGFDPDMFRRLYRSDRYEQMKENVLSLLRANQQLGRPVKITIGLRIDQSMKKALSRPGFQEVIELADSIESNYYFDSWSGRVRQEDLPPGLRTRSPLIVGKKRRLPCGQLWVGIGVLVDGTLTACSCRDLNGDSDLVLGNIKEKSLGELVHSPYLKSLREDWFSARKIPALCRDCRHYFPYTYLMLKENRLPVPLQGRQGAKIVPSRGSAI